MVKLNSSSKNLLYIKVFYILSYFMLTNSLLFGFFLRSLGISFWRQILWALGLYIYYVIIIKYDYRRLKKINNYFKNSIVVIIISVILALIIFNFSIIRIVFSAVNYIYGIAFIAIGYVFRNTTNRFIVFKYFAFLGIFITIGLIVDSIWPIFKVLQISDELRVTSNDRATFLTENPTTLGFFYNFLLICNCYCFYISKNNFMKLLYLLSSLLFIIGALVTGSRQVLAVILISLSICFGVISLKNVKNGIFLISTLMLIFLFFSGRFFDYYTNFSNEELKERYTTSTIKEDNRDELWTAGLYQLSISNGEYWIFGHGIGATTNKDAQEDEYIHSHFENTFFARFGETGYLGFYVLILPILYCFKLFLKGKKTVFMIMMLTSTLAYVIISYVSPNGAAPQTQATFFITISFMIYQKYYDVDIKQTKT